MQNGPEERLAAAFWYAGPGSGGEDRTRLGNATKVTASAGERRRAAHGAGAGAGEATAGIACLRPICGQAEAGDGNRRPW